MSDLPELEDHLGEVRKLGYVAPFGDGLMLRAARTNIQTVTGKLISQDQWTECDYVTGYPLSLITDQGQQGSCTAWSDVGAGARQRYIRTGQVVVPSGYFIYDCINGGHDNGSNIIDSLTTIESVGAPPIAAYPRCLFPRNPPAPPPGVPMYKEDVAVTVGNSVECATALIGGMLPQVPILVNSNFEKWTSEGVAWGGVAPRSNQSNHSIYLAGLKKLPKAGWVFILVNSWRASWGPFKQGWCYIPLAAVDNPGSADDGYAHASTPAPDGTSNTPGAAA